jgi:PAS domain S-box-containing protein
LPKHDIDKIKKLKELLGANKELAFQKGEKKKRALELIIAKKELLFQNEEKEKRASELIIANKELVFQNEEKEKRASELIIANKELVFQNEEKEKRAAELIVANKELAFQNEEKEKRASELIIANKELVFQNEEKEKRAAELIIANKELEKVEEQFRLVVESAPNAMVLVNNEGFIILVNNQTEKLFGYKRNELIGNKLEILIPERFRPHHPEHRNTFFKKPQTRSMGAGRDLFAMKKDGTEIQVEIGLNPIETAKGHMVLASIIDITERKIQEVMLKKHNKELEQFAYIASHDLQEPLRTVSNYMQVFEEEYLMLLDDNARRYLHSVNNATKRMSLLIKSLLDFSRLGYNIKLTSVDCKKVIDDVIADLDLMIKTSNAIIEVTEMPQLNIYEIEIRQVFQNLITNAIKFQKKDIRPEIKIGVEEINKQWKFSVSDNGIGIASEYFERVFDIFQRLNPNEEYTGNGIGLSNCKKIVQLHQGEIWVESTLGQGTTFHFTIPNLII